MNDSLRNFRFAFWGILGAFLVYIGYMTYNLVRIAGLTFYQAYLSTFITQFVIIGSILMVELGVYWLIRKKLFYKSWVRIHIGSIWATLVVLPAVYLFCFYWFKLYETDSDAVSRKLSSIFGIAFLVAIAIGHLFFILTIVKSFTKKELPKPDAANSPDILDEFNQQSSGV